MPQYNTFVVRIWTSNDNGLHGQITHVLTQEKRDFLDLDLMLKFILENIYPQVESAEFGEEGEESRGEP